MRDFLTDRLARLPGDPDISQPLIAAGLAILLYGLAIVAARLVAPGVFAAATLTALFSLVAMDPAGQISLQAATASPAAVGVVLFGDYWLAVEAVSLLLFAALAAVLLLGKAGRETPKGGSTA